MNERDKELAKQTGMVYREFEDEFANANTDGVDQETMQKFAALMRADERKALEKIDWTAVMREGSLVTWADAQELGDRVLSAIRARGNT
jgi:hypothetical protein